MRKLTSLVILGLFALLGPKFAKAQDSTFLAAPGPSVTCCTKTKGFSFPSGSLVTLGGTLGTIDPVTGAFTVAMSTPYDSATIAMSPHGVLYSSDGQNLYKVNLGSQTFTLVGEMGGDSDFIGGLAFNSRGDLYATGLFGGFYSVNVRTGAATLISSAALLDDFVYDPLCDLFYGIKWNAGANGSDVLVTINYQDGTVTVIGDIGFKNLSALTYDGGILYGYNMGGLRVIINPQTGAGALTAPVSNLKYGSILDAASPVATGNCR